MHLFTVMYFEIQSNPIQCHPHHQQAVASTQKPPPPTGQSRGSHEAVTTVTRQSRGSHEAVAELSATRAGGADGGEARRILWEGGLRTDTA